MENTELFIIEGLKQGKEEAYRYLYEHHYVALCHVAKEYVGDEALAEHLVGDVIFHLWEVRETLDIRYLVRAVRNRCLDYLDSRKQKHEVTFSELEGDESLGELYILADDYPLGILLEKELEHKIRQAIGRLPEECRRVFLKSRFEEKKYEEIARELGISINTVKYHIKNALSLLCKELGEYLLPCLVFFCAIA